MSVSGRSGLGPAASGEIIRGVLNGGGNSSGPSIGASSLVTDANSGLSGGPQLQRSTSINNESYMRLPASPMSFSSNNISGSSVMDGSIVQQSSYHEQMQRQGASSATSQPTPNEHGNPLKRPRIDDDLMQQQVIQQLLQRQDSLQLQGHQNPQLQAMIHQQRLAQQRQQQQQQLAQSFPQLQRAQVNQQHQQLRHHLQQNAIQPAPNVGRPFDSGICARRLMQYMYHQRHRPPENTILYWRKFVLEYYAPRAKKRWCLSLYDNVGNHALGVFPQTAMDAWQCDICGSKSGKGFEATFEVLPRLCQIKFDRGVVDDLLFLDMPQECRLPNGIMVLKYAKAVQESVYEQLRVVREGQLQIVFTPELKILSWEFCARRHEEFFSRRLVAPQMGQLLQVAQKYQSAVTESGSAGLSSQDLQASCNMFVSAGRQLAKNLELQSLNDLGFSKRYVRCLQIAEVVNSMKDLIDFGQKHKSGPIESLKSYPRQAAAASKLHSQQSMQQEVEGEQSSLNKMMGVHPGMIGHMNNNHHLSVGTRPPTNGVSLSNHQALLRNSMGGPIQRTDPSTSSPFNGSTNHQQQQQLSRSLSQLNNNSSQVLHQQAIQQMLQEVMSSNNRGPPAGVGGGEVFRINAGAPAAPMMIPQNNSFSMMPNNNQQHSMSRSNSMKSVLNKPASSGGGRAEGMQMMPELEHDMGQEFAEFGGEAGDLGYGWKV